MLMQGRGKNGGALRGRTIAKHIAVPIILASLSMALPWASVTVHAPPAVNSTCIHRTVVTPGLSCYNVTTDGLFTMGVKSCIVHDTGHGLHPACIHRTTADGYDCDRKHDDPSIYRPHHLCDTLGPRKLAAGLSVTMLIGLLIRYCDLRKVAGHLHLTALRSPTRAVASSSLSSKRII
jgi:hypothetical protein